MSIDDRTRWEERHRRATGLIPRPSVMRLPHAPRSEALALDVACGQGRHAAALRTLGYDVVAMDVSMRALAHARTADASLQLVQADADAWPFLRESFDLVVQVDFLDRALLPLLRAALRPGGRLLIDTFLDDGTPNAEGPSNPAFLLKPGELARAFAGFELERYEEARGQTARAMLLARKRVS